MVILSGCALWEFARWRWGECASDILWGETCYPFSYEMTAAQLFWLAMRGEE